MVLLKNIMVFIFNIMWCSKELYLICVFMASIHRLNILVFDQNYVLQMNFSTEMSTVYMGKKKRYKFTYTWLEHGLKIIFIKLSYRTLQCFMNKSVHYTDCTTCLCYLMWTVSHLISLPQVGWVGVIWV